MVRATISTNTPRMLTAPIAMAIISGRDRMENIVGWSGVVDGSVVVCVGGKGEGVLWCVGVVEVWWWWSWVRVLVSVCVWQVVPCCCPCIGGEGGRERVTELFSIQCLVLTHHVIWQAWHVDVCACNMFLWTYEVKHMKEGTIKMLLFLGRYFGHTAV